MNMHFHRAALAAALVAGLAAAGAAAQQPVAPAATPPGTDKTARTRVLEGGAKVLQDNTPAAKFDIYLVGFHPMKDHPEQQFEAHHYCHQRNQDFAQCVLFDGNTGAANLHGVEYIISEKLFATLPQAERKYWHPHNGEILSGQLVAPGIPEAVEKVLMKDKMNSYGKTWHLWNTGHQGHPNDALPLGEPMLAWSFNRDGEDLPGLVAARDERMKLSTEKKRGSRADLKPLARPQSGVDELKGKFGRTTKDIPGVVNK